jgi:hypothetical protein
MSDTALLVLLRHSRRLMSWRFGLLLAVAIGAGIVAASIALGVGQQHPRALDRPVTTGDSPGLNVGEDLNLIPGETRKVGSWLDSNGNTRELFVGSSKGLPGAQSSAPVTCLMFVAPDGGTGGGCNPAQDFFMGHTVVWSSSTLTDQSTGDVQTFLYGVAVSAIRTLDLVDSSGSSVSLSVTVDGGFFYELPNATRNSGVKPQELLARDADGRVLERVDVQ